MKTLNKLHIFLIN